MIKLRKLTDSGQNQLHADLRQCYASADPAVINLPVEYINSHLDRYESEVINDYRGVVIEIDEKKRFANKFDAGIYFVNLFATHRFIPNEATWNFLSLVYYKQLLNTSGSIGEMRRMFLFNEFRYPYSHCLKAPYDFCQIHSLATGDYSVDSIQFLLLSPVHIHPGVYRRVLEIKDFWTDINVLITARKLFFDADMNPIRGADRKVRDLVRIYRQYGRAYDMHSLPSDKFLEILRNKHSFLFPGMN